MNNLDIKKTIYVNLSASALGVAGIDTEATISCEYDYFYKLPEACEQDFGATIKLLNIRVNDEPMKGWFQDEVYDVLLEYINGELSYELMLKMEDGTVVDLPIEDDEPKTVTSNHIQDFESSMATLEVYQCGCGYHMGFDTSYLEFVEAVVSAECPSCKNIIQTEEI